MELLGRYLNRGRDTARFEGLASVGAIARKPGTSSKRARRLTEAQVRELCQLYQAGESVYTLGEKFGISRQTVSKVLKRRGVETRYKLLTDDDVDEAVRLYEAGLSLAGVAEELGVSVKTVHDVLKRAGVAMRPVGTNQWQ